MYFANPWGLLGLLAVPAILIIHLYHRRFPPLQVAGLHLWGVETVTRSAGRRRDRLPVTLTLLLELLAAILLTLLISQPRIQGVGTVTHLVVVLDDTASMLAQPEGEATLRDQAIQALEERVGELGRGTVLTLIASGRRPVMLAGPAVSWTEARTALDRWQPNSPRHDFQPAWDLGTQLADVSGQLVFLTDTALEAEMLTLPKRMEVIAVGKSLDNVAITAARWSPDPTTAKGKIYLRVENFGRETTGVTITGKNPQGQVVFKNTLGVPPQQSLPLETEVNDGTGQLQIELVAEKDGLKIDNQATLIEPQTRNVKIALNLPAESAGSRLTKKALAVIPDIELTNAEQAHLVIATAQPLPESRPDLWWLGIGPLNPAKEARDSSISYSDRTSYLIQKQNPLLEGITLQGVIWGGAQETDLSMNPLISTRRGTPENAAQPAENPPAENPIAEPPAENPPAAEEQPAPAPVEGAPPAEPPAPEPATPAGGLHVLLGQLNGTQTTGFLLNIDLERSNISEQYDWPILLTNIIEQRRNQLPGLRRWNFRLNEEILFRLTERPEELIGKDDLTLVYADDGSRKPLARTALVELPPLEEPGVYSIQDGEQTIGQFAVNFHDLEVSNLRKLSTQHLIPEEADPDAEYRLDNAYSWLIFLALFLLLAIVLGNWFILRPKSLATRAAEV